MTSRPRLAPSQSGATLLIVIGYHRRAGRDGQHARLRHRQHAGQHGGHACPRTKASTVGEAAMDGRCIQLGAELAQDTATPTTVLRSTPRGSAKQFSDTASSRDPPAAVSSAAASTTTRIRPRREDDTPRRARWDANDDSLCMWRAGQASGSASARFQALVKRTYVNTTFPRKASRVLRRRRHRPPTAAATTPRSPCHSDGTVGAVSGIRERSAAIERQVFDAGSRRQHRRQRRRHPPIDSLIPQSLIRPDHRAWPRAWAATTTSRG